jgi:hypothetical protein
MFKNRLNAKIALLLGAICFHSFTVFAGGYLGTKTVTPQNSIFD